MKIFLFTLFLLFFYSCSELQIDQNQKPVLISEQDLSDAFSKPVDVAHDTIPIAEEPKFLAAWDHIKNQEWTNLVLDTLDFHGHEMMLKTPKDILNFTTSKFNTPISRKQFYVALISCMAKYESGFKPEEKYTENFRGQDGQFIISRGLLQISGSSGRAYGCDIPKDHFAVLHDPKINLECGMRILNRWLDRDGSISLLGGSTESPKWLGGARYWAVLRQPKVEKIKSCTLNLTK